MTHRMIELKHMDGRTNHGKRGAIINTISYEKKLDSHITELVAEKNKRDKLTHMQNKQYITFE